MSTRYASLKIIALSALFVPMTAIAAESTCSIKSVLRLNENGSFVTHEWTPNYQNREFTVDRTTGKVTGTTALKVRLANYNKEYAPQILASDKKGDSYKAVTLYEDTGQTAMLLINDAKTGEPEPFFYYTNIGMVLTGTCSDKN